MPYRSRNRVDGILPGWRVPSLDRLQELLDEDLWEYGPEPEGTRGTSQSLSRLNFSEYPPHDTETTAELGHDYPYEESTQCAHYRQKREDYPRHTYDGSEVGPQQREHARQGDQDGGHQSDGRQRGAHHDKIQCELDRDVSDQNAPDDQ